MDGDVARDAGPALGLAGQLVLDMAHAPSSRIRRFLQEQCHFPTVFKHAAEGSARPDTGCAGGAEDRLAQAAVAV
ncbi:hypothetical protein GCM10009549_17160 [Streptomyces thermoalcalitolerans]|uniref:Uncharacterized protein n=1 Tax=Streptomyces thermoalcalitolerans TaxID=65605 RepID=A0ABN1NJD9_9ACTN